jgi:ABC-type antimicrobial peptide transport system permease subunit
VSALAGVRLGLAYGMLATRRRSKALLLPVVTTATGAFLLVQVLTLAGTVRAEAAALGSEQEVFRATLLIAVVVLLVGVVEVAICTTRTVVHRTREIGVLGANGVPRAPVVSALLVEPVVAAVTGALAGGLLAAVGGGLAVSFGLLQSGPAPADAAAAIAAALGVCAVAALVTSAVPAYRAASRPPIRSLSAGG